MPWDGLCVPYRAQERTRAVGAPTGAFGSRPAADQEPGWAAQSTEEPRVSEPFRRISKDPLGNHTPRGSGMASGRGHGKGSRGWGPWDGVPLHSHRPLPH